MKFVIIIAIVVGIAVVGFLILDNSQTENATSSEGTMDSILFPDDPIDSADDIVDELSDISPPTPDRYIIGPMGKFTYEPETTQCNVSYPDVCIPYPPDLDCDEIGYSNFRVIGDDPHGFDRDNDGIGCES